MTRAEFESAVSHGLEGRPLRTVYLRAPHGEDGAPRLIAGHALVCRQNGFTVVLPDIGVVQEALDTLTTEDGAPLSLSQQTELPCETVRGRHLGSGSVLLVDLPWEALDSFIRTLPRDGAQYVTFLQVDGTTARPRAAEAVQAAYAWVDDMDPETAHEYHSAAEPQEEEGEEELLPTPAATAAPGLPVPPPQIGGVGTPPVDRRQEAQHGLFNQGRRMSPEEWETLRRLAGPPPGGTGRVEQAQRVDPAQGLQLESEFGALPPADVADPSGELQQGSDVAGVPEAECAVAGKASRWPLSGQHPGCTRRAGQRVRRQLRDQGAFGPRSVPETGGRFEEGRQNCGRQRFGGIGAQQHRTGPHEELCQPKSPFRGAPSARPCGSSCGSRVGDRTQEQERGAPGVLQQTSSVCRAGGARQWQTVPRVAPERLPGSLSTNVAGPSCSGFEALQPALCSPMVSRKSCLPKGLRLCGDEASSDRCKESAATSDTRSYFGSNRTGEAAAPSAPEPPKGRGRACMTPGSGLRGLDSSSHRPSTPGFPNFDPQCTDLIDPLIAARMVDAFYNCGSSLSWFARSSLSKPACTVEVGDVSPDLWPVPPPRWRWTACIRGDARSHRRKRRLTLQARLLQLVVCALNWECLGYPKDPPKHARIGAPTTAAQQKVLDLLEAQIAHFLCAPPFAADDLGRSSEKFNSIARMLQELPFDSLRGEDLSLWASVLRASFHPYKGSGVSEGRPSHASCQPGGSTEPSFVNFRNATALPVVAERIKWRYPPSFDPKPFLEPLLRSAYDEPAVLRKASSQWPVRTPAKVHCSRQELLRMAAKWDNLGAVRITPADALPWDECVGLFSVSKSAAHDRLIVNPTVANSRSHTITHYSRTLAPGSLLTLLRLEPNMSFRFAADDLSDYYYTFRISPSRAVRNSIRCRFQPAELAHLQCAAGLRMEGPQLLSLNTLAVGDSLAVEVGQAAHYGVLRDLAGALLPKEVLLCRQPVPRSDCVELLAIDDHICIQKVKTVDLPKYLPGRDTQIMDSASRAYRQVGLVLNDDKKRRFKTLGVLLGAELDGLRGIVCPPRIRVWSLAVLTAVVAERGSATRELLEKLLGCWIHAVMFRRPVFAVIDSLFKEGQGLPRHQVFSLSNQSRNELLMLCCLCCCLQTDLRAGYDPALYCMGASPHGGAVCSTQVGEAAAFELWRHRELRGYHTRLQSEVSAILTEKGIQSFGAESFGDDNPVPNPFKPVLRSPSQIPKPLREGILFDCIEIFRGTGNWSICHSQAGLVVHTGFDLKGPGSRRVDVLEPGVRHELVALALRAVVREWHAGVPCVSFGTLRRPRVRSRACPNGFDAQDPFTQLHNRMARLIAFVFSIAIQYGQFVSVEQPAGTSLYHMHCYRTLVMLGCVVSTFCFCSYGSPFLKRSRWLHNKPRLCRLESSCHCSRKGNHFEVRGTFTAERLEEFLALAKPSAEVVYGVLPRVGQSVAEFSGAYPLRLASLMASGSVASARGHTEKMPLCARERTARWLGLDPLHLPPALEPGLEPFPEREWFEDPEWVSELCRSLPFREVFRYTFKKPGHINVNESRVYKSWVKSLARRGFSIRAVGILDSRVTIGAAAKGRSSSFAISRILQGCLGYVLGSGLYTSLLHCYSGDNVADNPSRGKPVQAPTREVPLWLESLLRGDTQAFDQVVLSAKIKKIPARWLRFLLLLGGDIERNPGPQAPQRRGPLDLEAGFAPSTAKKMQKSFAGFVAWLAATLSCVPEAVFESSASTAAALRAYGLHLYENGFPRYLYVYAITAMQDKYPVHRNFLTAAWQVDKKWQRAEPGNCRPVLPVAAVRAAIGLALLWEWKMWAGLVMIGFLAMLHPAELVALERRDLVFPSDTLGHTRSLFVHLRNPKTSRFARRQHGRIDDPCTIRFLQCLFGNLGLEQKLYPASLHRFRRQWDAIMTKLGLPCRASQRGATPGVLRGSGATHFYICTENIPLLAWRGRWARTKTLEFYLQEVAAQVLFLGLSETTRSRIKLLDQASDSLVEAFSDATQQ